MTCYPCAVDRHTDCDTKKKHPWGFECEAPGVPCQCDTCAKGTDAKTPA
jgi:hypothetical protein